MIPLKALKKAKNDYQVALDDYEEKAKILNAIDESFKAKNKLYLDAQAGILAETL